MAIPLEIIGLNRPEITIVWEDEHRTVYPARQLRLLCRCAHCVDEMSGKPRLNPDTVSHDIVAKHIELVGGYAITITWSDRHSTGIYHFRRLREQCPCSECQALRASAN
jgi:ATP-binding protein involved in chromosome partitioning